jgi:predicted PurR-regulated permease PerM
VQVTIPRWVQVALIPVAVFLALYLGRAVSHALFVFLLAALIALLLNPLVDILRRLHVPRAVSVPLVYASFIAVVVVIVILTGPLLVRQARDFFALLPQWGNEVQDWLLSVQGYLADRGVNVDVQDAVNRISDWLQTEGIVGGFATFLIVLIISFYMLVDGRRISRSLARVIPVDDDVAAQYLRGLQTSFIRFMKGQALLAFSVGLAAGIGVWVLGWDVIGVWPEGASYAFLFGVWAGITEVIPYIGPWLGAFPPVLLALFHSPEAALWVAFIFFMVQLLENHILVPNIMGSTVGVHPLVVIFALLAGAEVAGILGMLVVLPLIAMFKHTWDFFRIDLSRGPWLGDDGLTLTAMGAAPAEGDVEVIAPTKGASEGTAEPALSEPDPVVSDGVGTESTSSDSAPPGPTPPEQPVAAVAPMADDGQADGERAGDAGDRTGGDERRARRREARSKHPSQS